MRDQHGEHDGKTPLRNPSRGESQHRDHGHEHEQLTQLYAHVEAGERHQNVVAGKLQRVPERKRKPEPVHQPEPEAHQPAPLETVDPMEKIWIGGNGRGDSHILKFTRDGKFLAQYGKPGMEQDSNATDHFGLPAKISFDATGDEAFVADGYRNRRVAVLDAETGEFKRYWGAYGNKPSDADLGNYDPDAPLIDQFRNPVHCAEPANDGLVYVCDRVNDRIQVFKTDGTFVTERQYAPRTLGDGSTWDIAFSPDAEQKFMYLADGKNMKVYVILRATLDVLTSFGDGGRQPGQFFAVHSIATDSKGNIYTTETYEGNKGAEIHLQGDGGRDEDEPGNGLA
jgi:hypothetical protein